jgi:hypothetical protein
MMKMLENVLYIVYCAEYYIWMRMCFILNCLPHVRRLSLRTNSPGCRSSLKRGEQKSSDEI